MELIKENIQLIIPGVVFIAIVIFIITRPKPTKKNPLLPKEALAEIQSSRLEVVLVENTYIGDDPVTKYLLKHDSIRIEFLRNITNPFRIKEQFCITKQGCLNLKMAYVQQVLIDWHSGPRGTKYDDGVDVQSAHAISEIYYLVTERLTKEGYDD